MWVDRSRATGADSRAQVEVRKMPKDGDLDSSNTSGTAICPVHRWSWPKLVIAAAFISMTAGFGAPGADAASAKVRTACAGDYKRLCPRYKVGSSRMRACMEAKQSEISSRCIDALIDSGEVNRRGRRR